MKAFLLAAGLGTRLRPLTDTVPKCMVPINGAPLLDYWFRLFARHGVDEVLINTHHLPQPVEDYVALHNQMGKLPHVVTVYEPQLLGSGGTVRANKSFVDGEDSFFICYADNLTNMDLTALRTFHDSTGLPASIALFRAKDPRACGIVEMDDAFRVVSFEEKPAMPKSDLANAGVYIVSHRIFDEIPDTAFSDFGKDVLPKLVGNMSGWETRDYLLDVGTPENYAKAQEDASKLGI